MTMSRILLLSAAVILEIYHIYNGFIKRNSKIKMLHQILQLIPVKPSQIIQKYKNHQYGPTLQMCRGNIFAGEPCTAILSSNQKIVFSKLIDRRIGQVFYSHKILRTKQPSFMLIKDQISKIKIYQTHKTVIIPTKMISTQSDSIFFNKKKTAVSSMLNNLQNLIDRNLNYSQFGAQNLKELVLPEGAQCVVLGKFSQCQSEVNCLEPFIIAPSKQQMITLIQQDMLSSSFISFVLIIATGAAMVFLLRQLWALFKRYQSKTNDLFTRLKKIFLRSRICFNCKKNMSSILSKSCMHMTLCQQCWIKQSGICLQCKKIIKDTLQIFVC